MAKYGKRYSLTKTEAFNRLGYPHKSTVGIWTTDSENKDRVLLTIWDEQTHGDEDLLWVSTDHEHPVGEPYREVLARQPKHIARATRLRRVMRGEAKLDVVVLFGSVKPHPAKKVEGAMPWIPEEQFGRVWRIISVNPENGFFRAEAS